MKGLLAIAGVLAFLMAATLAVFYLNVRPKNLPLESAWQYVRFERDAGDEMVHAYTGTRWLDSQRYFVIKGDPSRFDARIKKLSETSWSSPGAPHPWTVRIKEGPGKELWYRGERLPSWWDVDDLPSAVAADVGPEGRHNGFLSIFSKERGLIYIVDR